MNTNNIKISRTILSILCLNFFFSCNQKSMSTHAKKMRFNELYTKGQKGDTMYYKIEGEKYKRKAIITNKNNNELKVTEFKFYENQKDIKNLSIEEKDNDIYSEFELFPCINSVLKKKKETIERVLDLQKAINFNNILPHQVRLTYEYIGTFRRGLIKYKINKNKQTTEQGKIDLRTFYKYLVFINYNAENMFMPKKIRIPFEDKMDKNIYGESKEIIDSNFVNFMINKIFENNKSLFQNIEIEKNVIDISDLDKDTVFQEKNISDKKFYIIRDGDHYTLLFKDFKNKLAYYIDSSLYSKTNFETDAEKEDHETERFRLYNHSKFFKLENFTCLYNYGYYQQANTSNCCIFALNNLLKIARLIQTNKFDKFLNDEINKNIKDKYGFYYSDIFPEGLEKFMQSLTNLSTYLNKSKEEIIRSYQLENKHIISYDYNKKKYTNTIMWFNRLLWRAHIYSDISDLTTNDHILFTELIN
ncbi:MAG: hypothetical protein GY830_07375 [Bacteroidetes bacterium]|nr:hypothetical protein [Bacteroidota bacterium]